MDKRSLIKAMVAAPIVMGLNPASAQNKPFKIGLLTPMTGPFASTGKQMLAGVKLYMAQQGVNIILDMVGGDYMQRNLKALSVDGRLVQIAFLQPSKTEVDWIGLMVKRLTFTGSTLRPRSVADKAQMAAELKQNVWPMMEQGKCLPVIHQVFDLDQAAQAHALMESSTHIGKIMLKVAGD